YTHLNQIVAICKHVCCDPPALTKERRAACVLIADELMKVIERWDKVRASRWNDDDPDADKLGEHTHDLDKDVEDSDSESKPDESELEVLALLRSGNKRTGIVASMVRMLSAIEATKHLTRFLAHILAYTWHYDLRSVVIPDVKALYAQSITPTS